MDHLRTLNRNFETTAWGALFIWWGIVMTFDALTIGIGAIGTGLILLGVNAARSLKGIPARGSTTAVGLMALVWGALDQARSALALPVELSFAMMLIVIGTTLLALVLLRARKTGFGGVR